MSEEKEKLFWLGKPKRKRERKKNHNNDQQTTTFLIQNKMTRESVMWPKITAC